MAGDRWVRFHHPIFQHPSFVLRADQGIRHIDVRAGEASAIHGYALGAGSPRDLALAAHSSHQHHAVCSGR